MAARTWFSLPLAGAALVALLVPAPAPACCPAWPRSGKPVVNADQTVIIIWDAATKTEHFIRKASFKSAADDFGFLVPTPTQPELEESGNDAFPYIQKLTEPEVITKPRPSRGLSCGCSKSKGLKGESAGRPLVEVRAEKEVAGFKAVVLEARSANALVAWLTKNGYSFSPAVEAWAKPYVAAGWMMTALKVAKPGAKTDQRVVAGALRLSFRTDRPLFPYREPDYTSAAEALEARHRLLRIYFLAEARYRGDLDKGAGWTGRVAWANKLNAADRKQVLALLKFPETTGPAEWWLTEFEDDWPYRVAPADVYFARDANQATVKRRPIIQYVFSIWSVDVMVTALAAVAVGLLLFRRIRRERANPAQGM